MGGSQGQERRKVSKRNVKCLDTTPLLHSAYEFGQPKTFKTRRGETKIIDGYDARGRETHHYWLNAENQIDPATPAIESVWDNANRLTRIWNIYSIIDYTYDQAGQVRTEGTTVTGGGPIREVRYCRYPNGEVSQITYPNGPTVVNRFYTARGQLSSVGWGSGATSYVYLPDGRVDYQPFTNGVTTRYGYDGRGMIQSVSHKNGAGQNLAFREYWRDDRDRILAWKRGVGGPNPMENGRGDRYRYDAEGQLEMADYRALYPDSTTPQDPMRRDVFHYDQLGNRMGSANVIASWGPGLVNFTRENNGLNQYVSWTRGPINYDDDMGSYWGAPGHANGVTMQEGWITASYNALKQPKAIWCPSYAGGALAQYMWFGFDPLGRCVKRWMGSETGHAPGSNPATYYYYDGWNVIQEGPGGSTLDRTYVHGGRVDEIVASQAGGEWAYHHYDARGHCILLTKASDGTILEQYDYDAFGYPYFYSASGGKLGSAAQFGNRFLFTGREWLKDLRVYDYRHRMYQPELGRFLQPDPTGFEAGDYNLYRYCHNDPVNKSDPTGLWVDRTWDKLMYDQSGEKRSFEVVELIKSLHSDGYVSVAQLKIVDRNEKDSTPGKPSRNLGGSKLDPFGKEMAKEAFSTRPPGREQISYLFEKDGAAGSYIASTPIAGGDREMRRDEGGPRKSAPLLPNFIPKGYHYVGFSYSHLQPDRVIPLIDRRRAWRYRLNAYLAVPHQGSSFPDIVQPYHYDPNVFPTH